MRYVAAYLLAALSKESPSKNDVTKILESVGLDIDDDRLDKVILKFSIHFCLRNVLILSSFFFS